MSGRAAPAGRLAPARPPVWALAASAALFVVASNRRGRDTAQGRPAQGRAGRSAGRPSEIPPPGWRHILWRVYQGLDEDRILANAAGVTFYALLAVFPAIAALVSIYGFFADPGSIASHLDSMKNMVPGGALEVVRGQLTRISTQHETALGIGFLVGLAVSLWSANSGTKALFDSLNVVYGENEKRSFLKLNAISLGFTIASILLLIAALGGMIAMPALLDALPLAGALTPYFKFAAWPIMFVLIAIALAFVYRWGPSRNKARWQWVSWGSAFATLAWVAGSALFSWYATNLGTFNKTYGSLGAVIGFMTWIWLSAIVVLIGGKLNAEIEHQTARDTTEGGAKPLGARGAKMADTVAE